MWNDVETVSFERPSDHLALQIHNFAWPAPTEIHARSKIPASCCASNAPYCMITQHSGIRVFRRQEASLTK